MENRNITSKLVCTLLAVALLSLGACSRDAGGPESRGAGPALAERSLSSDMVSAQKERNPYLAYEHHFRIELPEDKIRARFEATLDQCASGDFYDCTLVESSLNEDDNYVNARIRARIKNEGVDPLITIAARDGEIASQTSRAEDLSQSVMDTDQRLEMLRSYRERLQDLETSAAGDIESLIKVTSELAQVQSDIEQTEGNRAYLQKRLDLDLLNIQFYSDRQDNLLAPIARALDEFFYNLSAGTSSIITGIAWALPWFILLLLGFFVVRWTWRRVRR